MREAHEVILRPIVTERSARLQDELDTYSFIVVRDANKHEIRRAVERLFGVHVVSVRTANYQGKWRRVGRQIGRKPAYKKAVVKLVEGDTIDVYEGI